MADLWLGLGNIIPIANTQLNIDDGYPFDTPLGTHSFMRDGFGGLRIFQYVRNASGSALTQGALAERNADTTEASITTGSTTGFTKTGASYGTYTTPNPGRFYGQMLKIDTNGGTGGAAPEGESGVITSNTATAVTINSNRPFSAAPPAASAVRVVNFTAVKAAVAGELAVKMSGIVAGASGISDGNCGWVQTWGVCPDAQHKASTAFTADDPVIAGTGVVDVKASTTAESWIARQIGTHNNNVASNKSPIFVQLFGWLRPIN